MRDIRRRLRAELAPSRWRRHASPTVTLGASTPEERRLLDPGAYKLLEINHGNESASRSLEWYRTVLGVRSEIEIYTVLHHLRLRANSRVLEMGCGVGRITLAIAPHVRSITAVDIAPANIEMLRQHARDRGLANVTGHVSDMNEVRLDGQRFDRAVAVQSIQHIPEAALRLDAVRRIREALNPAGLFVTVNYRWGGNIADEKEGTHSDGRYRYAFTAEELRQLLSDAGFTRIKVGGCVNTPYRAERFVTLAPWAFIRLDAALSRLPVSCRTGNYVIASGRA